MLLILYLSCENLIFQDSFSFRRVQLSFASSLPAADAASPVGPAYVP